MQPASSSVATHAPDAPRAVSSTGPAWFRAALAAAPARNFVDVDGVPIETLSWGEPGAPGVLLIHGFSAHADWWSFVAPLLRRSRRVVACSLSGMGRSGWRAEYSLAQYAREAFTVAKVAGLFAASAPPIVVGHSFGSFVARTMALQAGERLGGIVLVDGVLAVDEDDDEYDGVPRLGHRHRVYADLGQAMGRFRLSPPQPCENTFAVDYLARTSLHEVTGPDGTRGWCFDPDLRAKVGRLPLTSLLRPPACRMALMFGERSLLLTPPRIELLQRHTPRGTPWVEIPDAGHHVMLDQPLALVAALRACVEAWQPQSSRSPSS